jgi:hypothetical protein
MNTRPSHHRRISGRNVATVIGAAAILTCVIVLLGANANIEYSRRLTESEEASNMLIFVHPLATVQADRWFLYPRPGKHQVTLSDRSHFTQSVGFPFRCADWSVRVRWWVDGTLSQTQGAFVISNAPRRIAFRDAGGEHWWDEPRLPTMVLPVRWHWLPTLGNVAAWAGLIIAVLLILRLFYGRRTSIRLQQRKCAHCGYALTGLLLPVCPECGSSAPLERTK